MDSFFAKFVILLFVFIYLPDLLKRKQMKSSIRGAILALSYGTSFIAVLYAEPRSEGIKALLLVLSLVLLKRFYERRKQN